MRGWPLVSLATPQEAAVIEHVFGKGIQRPVISLSRIARFPWNFNEAIVQRQIVPYGILPRWKFVVIIRKPGHYELADATKGQLLLRRLQYRHCD